MARTRTQSGSNLVRTWLERQPLETKLAACLLSELSVCDVGNPDLASSVFGQYEADLLAAAQDEAAPIPHEVRMVLGAWLSQWSRR